MAGGVMSLVFLLVGVAVIGGVALLISGRWREGMPEVTPDGARPADLPLDVPVGSLGAADLEQVRLEQVTRGYRMQDVDDLLDRLGRELEARDEEIERLRSQDDPDASP